MRECTMGTLTERIRKGPSEDMTCEPDTSDKKEQVTKITESARPLVGVARGWGWGQLGLFKKQEDKNGQKKS